MNANMNKYSYLYDEEAAAIEKKREEAKKPPVAHKERDIQYHSVPGCFLLSCIPIFRHFFVFHWMARLNDDLRDLANDYPSTPGWKVVLFHFLTLRIYTYFWMLRQCDRVNTIKTENGDHSTKSPGLYLVLHFFGLSWIALATMQSEVNNQL